MSSARRLKSQWIPIRWRIFFFLFAIGFLEYLQQRGLTVAAERMMPTLHLSQMQIGWVEQAFVVGYALFSLPGGILGQRWGARWTFLLIGVVSALCIVSTSLSPELLTGTGLFVALCACQFFMGIAQSPTFPVSTGVFEAWFQPRQWPLVQGLQTMGLGFGAAVAPPVVAALMITVGWQQALLWTALPAIPLALYWFWYGRNSPQAHASVSEEELAQQRDTASEPTNERLTLKQLAAILRDRHVVLLALAYFGSNYVFYLLGNWCFLYLIQERHFSVIESSWLSVAPPIAAGLGAGGGGALASLLYSRFGSRTGLRLTPLIAMPLCGLLLLVAVHSTNAYLAVGLLTACFGLVELTEGSFWAAAMMLGRSNTMAVGGILNTGGSMAGVVGIPIVAYLSGHGAWNTAFLLGGALALASGGAWLFIDVSRVPPDAELPPPHPVSDG